ncbi:hypothetical protein CC1G_10355 [Coprinopsis cinerea okayama7|uniref:Uncharacterized protein n=1 Tax=Coprinopsis cinerea (strain Okayama-7 / 130 / ATCC MYA-4618 / FGSC 9003) TaxID=240176 RepID=A8PE80_COPC7|nr:hypothetical protein CC1G_10355 [Coprinopsis cinerea okayama7\|eukprot:XP_001840741.1 hypothetical protein CC1G_10355 [Coprinopsis cinerea okayama7\
MSQLLSPPSSPRDHRHYIPRRPSPLSLPPLAGQLTASSGSSNFQPFSLSAFVIDSPRAGGKVPRYPLEKQRRAWKELEEEQQRKRQQQQMQRQEPMQIRSSSVETLSPTCTLPLTPRSAKSSASSAYSQHDDETNNGKSKLVQRSFCAALFGSCFAVFHTSAARIETAHAARQIASAR